MPFDRPVAKTLAASFLFFPKAQLFTEAWRLTSPVIAF